MKNSSFYQFVFKFMSSGCRGEYGVRAVNKADALRKLYRKYPGHSIKVISCEGGGRHEEVDVIA